MLDIRPVDDFVTNLTKDWNSLISSVERDFKYYYNVFQTVIETIPLLNTKQYDYPFKISNVFEQYCTSNNAIVCPGVPGTQQTTYMYLTQIFFEISAYYTNMSDSIKIFSDLRIVETIGFDIDEIQKNMCNVQAMLMLYNEEKEKTVNNFKTLNSLKELIENLNLKKDKKRLKVEFPRYVEISSELRKSMLWLTYYAEKLLVQIKSSAAIIRDKRNELCTYMFQFLYRHVELLRGFSLGIKQAFKYLGKLRSDLSFDIRDWILHKKIVRTKLPLENLTDFSFSYQDVTFMKPLTSKQFINNDAPLYLGVVKQDFVGEDMNELTVTANQDLFIYETPVDKWVLVSDTPDGPSGYVPLSVVDIKPYKFAVSTVTKLGADGFLTLAPAQVIVVITKTIDDDILFCRDFAGNTGNVLSADVIVE